MNREEYRKWRKSTLASLLCLYSLAESEEIMQWFDNIKGSGEMDLLGFDKFNAMQAVLDTEVFQLHQSMSARVWAYAPYIIQQMKVSA